MPELIINTIKIEDKDTLVAEIAETSPPVQYFFAGDTLEAQTLNLESLAQTMVDAGEDMQFFTDELDNYLILDGRAPEDVVEQLFQNCDTLCAFDAEVVFTTESFLLADLEKMGQYLLEFFP